MSASESSESDEMTAEEQNRSNTENDDIQRVISTFMQLREETLEEMVGGFMYLTMDDLKKSSNPAVVAALKRKENTDDGSLLELVGEASGSAKPVSVCVQSSAKTEEVAAVGAASGNSGEDDLEEETLDCMGANQQNSASLFRNRPASLTKFDNFVTSEDVAEDDDGGDVGADDGETGSDDEWLSMSGYTASFGSDGGKGESQSSKTRDNTPAAVTSLSKDKAQLPTLTSSSHPQPSQSPSDAEPQNYVMAKDSESILEENGLTAFGHGTDTQASEESSETVKESSSNTSAPEWILNPGEADEETSQTPVMQTVSILEFSTKIVEVSDTSGEPAVDATEECSNDVVPFVLDEDFDYDTVAYTPKFTAAEMEYLTSFLPEKS